MILSYNYSQQSKSKYHLSLQKNRLSLQSITNLNGLCSEKFAQRRF